MEPEFDKELCDADRELMGDRIDSLVGLGSMVRGREVNSIEMLRQGPGVEPGSVWTSWLSVIVLFVILALTPVALSLLFTGPRLWHLIALLIGVGVLVVSFLTAHLYKRHKQRRAQELESSGGNSHVERGHEVLRSDE